MDRSEGGCYSTKKTHISRHIIFPAFLSVCKLVNKNTKCHGLAHWAHLAIGRDEKLPSVRHQFAIWPSGRYGSDAIITEGLICPKHWNPYLNLLWPFMYRHDLISENTILKQVFSGHGDRGPRALLGWFVPNTEPASAFIYYKLAPGRLGSRGGEGCKSTFTRLGGWSHTGVGQYRSRSSKWYVGGIGGSWGS